MYLLNEFARKTGSKDKTKRKSKLVRNLVLGGLGAAATGLYLKKRGKTDLANAKQQIIKLKNKITGNTSKNEGLDLAFKFKQELLKRQDRIPKAKVKNYNIRRLAGDAGVASSAILGGSLLAIPFANRLAKVGTKKNKRKNNVSTN